MRDLDPDARAILDAARAADDPSEAECQRLDRALAIKLGAAALIGTSATVSGSATAAATALGTASATSGVAATASATTASATIVAGASAAGLATKGVLLGVLLAAAGGVSWRLLARPVTPAPRSASTSPAPRSASTSLAPMHSSAVVAHGAAPVGIAAPVGVTPPALAPREIRAEPAESASVAARDARRIVPSRHAAPAVADSLEEENSMLGDARTALTSGDPRRAIVLLDEHARRFPAGALRDVRRVTRVRALCDLGRVEEARAAAQGFLAEAPGSPLADALARTCVQSATNSRGD